MSLRQTMPDREKVIKWLSELEGFLFTEYGKAQAQESRIWYDRFLAVSDALTLLKEQEAVKPVEVNNKETGCFKCGNCGAVVLSYSYPGIITDKYRSYHQFCGKCGRRVLWEGR